MQRDGLIGRRHELERLRAWLDGARDGSGRLVLCVGEPGIGKTRVGQELAGLALAQGVTTAWGRCVEADGAPPFWPWRQVLRSLEVDADTVLAGAVESPEERFRLFDDVTQAVLARGDPHGLLVILDDVHWADEASLLVLRHLAGHLADARTVVFATLRQPAPGSVISRLLPDLLRSPGV